MVLNFAAMSNFTLIDCMSYNILFVEHCSKKNNVNLLFIVCIADLY